MVLTDFEGALVGGKFNGLVEGDGISALHYAASADKFNEAHHYSSASKLKEAYRIFGRLLKEDRENSAKARTLDEFIELSERSREPLIREGAALLEGQSPYILNVKLPPSKAYPSVIELFRRDGKLQIMTCTDYRTVVESFRGSGQPYEIVASSSLKIGSDGMLTGELERYCGAREKAEACKCDQSMVVNSNVDLLAAKKASDNGQDVFFANNGCSLEDTFLSNLRRFKIKSRPVLEAPIIA